MAMKHHISSLALLAAAIILLSATAASAAHRLPRSDLCEETDGDKNICRALLKGEKNPLTATIKSINHLISEAGKAKALAAGLKGDSKVAGRGLSSCVGSYDKAIFDLKKAMDALDAHDKATAQINISSALTDLMDCSDSFAQFGLKSPLQQTNSALVDMTRTALALVFQVPRRF